MTTDKMMNDAKITNTVVAKEPLKVDTASKELAKSGTISAQLRSDGAKAEYDVILKSVGGKMTEVIRVIREMTGLSLKEAKELVEGVPKTVKAGVSKEEAESLKAALEAVGATVELKQTK